MPSKAPYNFVRLPESIVPAQEPLPGHDVYASDRFTGEFRCTLTTETPLYIRGPRDPGSDAAGAAFCAWDINRQEPVIPGSSLRGMLRTLVEVISFSKMPPIMNRRMYYRAIAGGGIAKTYRNMLTETISLPNDIRSYKSRVRGGFLRRIGNRWNIEECEIGRIKDAVIASLVGIPGPNDLYTDTGPNGVPEPAYQNLGMWATLDPGANYPMSGGAGRMWYRAATLTTAAGGGQAATLVLTGPVPHKELSFVFVPQTPLSTINVPPDMVEEFEDKHQVTPWQEEAFPADRPTPGSRPRGDGGLRDGEPVFFLTEPGKPAALVFFGRAQMFRLPYMYTAADMLPKELGDEKVLDMAEAIFGFAKSNKVPPADRVRRGRVRVSDGIFHPQEGVCTHWQNAAFTPKVLSSPKPTSYQHYLTQPSDEGSATWHYNSQPGATKIRGFKFHWHRPNPSIDDVRATDEEVREAPSQFSPPIHPLAPGNRFEFTIHFENLSQEELGALAWALTLPGPAGHTYRHHLGLAKPYGLGTVRIETKLHLHDQKDRYTRLFEGGEWNAGSAPPVIPAQPDPVSAYEAYVSAYVEVATAFHDHPRIRELLALHEVVYLDPDFIRYSRLEDEVDFRERLILPEAERVYQDHRPPDLMVTPNEELFAVVQNISDAGADVIVTLRDGSEVPGQIIAGRLPPRAQWPAVGDRIKVSVVSVNNRQRTVRVALIIPPPPAPRIRDRVRGTLQNNRFNLTDYGYHARVHNTFGLDVGVEITLRVTRIENGKITEVAN